MLPTEELSSAPLSLSLSFLDENISGDLISRSLLPTCHLHLRPNVHDSRHSSTPSAYALYLDVIGCAMFSLQHALALFCDLRLKLRIHYRRLTESAVFLHCLSKYLPQLLIIAFLLRHNFEGVGTSLLSITFKWTNQICYPSGQVVTAQGFLSVLDAWHCLGANRQAPLDSCQISNLLGVSFRSTKKSHFCSFNVKMPFRSDRTTANAASLLALADLGYFLLVLT